MFSGGIERDHKWVTDSNVFNTCLLQKFEFSVLNRVKKLSCTFSLTHMG